ncbi:Glutathione synthetase [hydrothermal vent metagenome]|uniref:Glutathione synthetase n=1 Tax=hydrothermal vent metagenome TaxID=652676 RepID=A0A3B0YFB2_9ZZZZ
MDPLSGINPKKDSTLAMMLAADKAGWEVHSIEMGDMWLRDGVSYATSNIVKVFDDTHHWFDIKDTQTIALADIDCLLMRKDPPFNMEYIYCTYLLQLASDAGALVVNNPQALRDANEKLFTAWFSQCCAPTLVSRQQSQIRDFLNEHEDIILKPLDGMGGESIFRVNKRDANFAVITETLTAHGNRYAMAQRFIPEISSGDKRILLINGEPVPYALARIPTGNEHRGNLAAGGRGEGVILTERDYWICQQLAPTLRAKGLLFVGIDVIGDYLTEINITSPTCIRELDSLYDLDIAGQLIQCIEAQLQEN